jgi:hypothetical protein
MGRPFADPPCREYARSVRKFFNDKHIGRLLTEFCRERNVPIERVRMRVALLPLNELVDVAGYDDSDDYVAFITYDDTMRVVPYPSISYLEFVLVPEGSEGAPVKMPTGFGPPGGASKT